ncbi:hypothetical protein M9M90_03890 [Phenylobacterium sp. LH3H17]|uniref:hypothetical protein n=1 Tax=Phenylobacterium sp. LH3H17 TaxID=2903901 RepID=UPI0020C9E217|nr:hypothetical protein [Phenylobacterium sp. LH3H17]UTP40328.1 hypothetical protein M9M90_03890 [Phenylobacterium sp. LH3H17]
MTAAATTKGRYAQMSLVKGLDSSVLKVSTPGDFVDKDFSIVSKSILELIHKHTGCNCLSGRIKVVIEDDFEDVIRVDLGQRFG